MNADNGRRTRVLIMGAGGRDFHNFNTVFRDHPQYEVVAFTATQIPDLAGRVYPAALAGSLYPDGIAIVDEVELPRLIREAAIDEVVFSYSDVSHEHVMHVAARVQALGAGFRLLAPRQTMLCSSKPVISITAVRTGCGKSPVARHVAALLDAAGLRPGIVRHPMAYGDLVVQAAQRFAKLADLSRQHCTIEEMEEYEPHLAAGHGIYAGVDYTRVLALAEAEADVIVWDGGNNDLPLITPDLDIVLVDPHRAGHERSHFPGEANLLRAQVVVITKTDTAQSEQLEAVRASIRRNNPAAIVIESAMPISADAPQHVRGQRVLVVEDGPTLTHGGMAYGAGTLAARRLGAAELVDARPYAVGSIRTAFAQYPHLGPVLPALGYGMQQIEELEATIAATDCDSVLIATPVDLTRIMRISRPVCRVRYEYADRGQPTLGDVIRQWLADLAARAAL
ncbi:cyclic 2,3-diphosphoglycerate synthase [Thiobacter aerophilum]|uniref:Cyclic 2,3-diphosphoglycerate synthase n=1 Tax=Thiobacter aerophilum TaxID=3121275 RepID=A0ABV0EDS9_9BURK